MLTLFSKLRRTEAEAGEHERKLPARGMTLIELLVSIAFLAVGLAGILALQVHTAQAGALANGRNMATILAESQSEWLRTMAINRVEFVSQDPEKLTASGQLCTDAPAEPCVYTRTTTITRGVPVTTGYAVSIKVQWLNKQIIYDTVVPGVDFF